MHDIRESERRNRFGINKDDWFGNIEELLSTGAMDKGVKLRAEICTQT